MGIETAFSVISILVSLLGVAFAYLAFKRNKEEDSKANGKNEGVMFSDIGYIKACVDRVEKNLSKVDERYRDIAERVAKAEEAIINIYKRVN